MSLLSSFLSCNYKHWFLPPLEAERPAEPICRGTRVSSPPELAQMKQRLPGCCQRATQAPPFQGLWANLHVSVLTCGRCSCCVHLDSTCVGFLTECQGCRANVVAMARCGCHCRAGVFGCHHGDGHASPLIWVLDCECGAFQGHSRRRCAETQHVDLLILAFRAALPSTQKAPPSPHPLSWYVSPLWEGFRAGSVLAVPKQSNNSLRALQFFILQGHVGF